MLSTVWYTVAGCNFVLMQKNLEKTYNIYLKVVQIDLQQLTCEHYAQLHIQA